jgi:myo-inositol-1(or 4)-monophosphatase
MIADVITAVREVAHAEVMPRFREVGRRRKADGSIVTEADLAAQRALAVRLASIAPVPLVGEEMTQAERDAALAGNSGSFWCVDPVDGTSNFANGIPFFAISVALFASGRPALGVVYNPANGELFHATRGGGAWLGDERLPLRPGASLLGEAVAGADLKRLPPSLAAALAARPPCHSQRNFGASALEWCYLAAGRLDAYVHGNQQPWDYAAGSLVLEEAGGSCATFNTEDLWDGPFGARAVIASLDRDAFTAWKEWVRARIGAHPA